MNKKIILGIFSLAFTISAVNGSNQHNNNNQGTGNLFDLYGLNDQSASHNAIGSTRRNISFKDKQESISVGPKRLSPEAESIRKNSPINNESNTPSIPVYTRLSVSPIEDNSFSQFSPSASLYHEANRNQKNSPVVTLNTEVQTFNPNDDQEFFFEVDKDGRHNTPVALHHTVHQKTPKTTLNLQKIETLKEAYKLNAMSPTFLIEAHLDVLSLTNKHLIDMSNRELKRLVNGDNQIPTATRNIISYMISINEYQESLNCFLNKLIK